MARRTRMATLALTIATLATPVTFAGSAHPFAKTCGSSTMIIRCVADGKDCTRSELVLRAGPSSPVVVPSPDGLENYDPVALSCSRASDAKPFFVVEYGDASHHCASCEWHHIYAADGRRLTESDPAFVSDPSRPGAQAPQPNTADFTRVAKKLGLSLTPAVYGD